MARPSKSGLDYFSMDVHMDDKIQLIEAEYGVTGFAVVVKLFQKIYGGLGYYCGWDSEVALLFARSCGLGGSVVSEIVTSALRRNIFSAELLNKYGILTSCGIQKRYLEATARRRQVELIREYLLLDVSILPDNVVINSINVDNNPVNVCNNPQSKGKQSKEESKKKVEEGIRAAASTDDGIAAYALWNMILMSDRNREELAGFREHLPDDLIRYAIDEACASGVRSWAYVREILIRYHQKKIRTVEAAIADKEAFRQRKKAQPSSSTNPALNYEQRSSEETGYNRLFVNLDDYGKE